MLSLRTRSRKCAQIEVEPKIGSRFLSRQALLGWLRQRNIRSGFDRRRYDVEIEIQVRLSGFRNFRPSQIKGDAMLCRRYQTRSATSHNHGFFECILIAEGGSLSRNRCFRFSIERVLRVQRTAHFGRLVPDRAGLPAKRGIHFSCHGFEGIQTLAPGIDFQQLEANLVTVGILAQRFLEDFLRLRIATIGHVDFSLGDGINFAGIDRPQSGLTEIGQERGIAGVDLAATGTAQDRVGLEIAMGHYAVFEAGDVFPAPARQHFRTQQAQQQDCRCAAAQVERVFHRLVEQGGFRLLLLGEHRLGFLRLGFCHGRLLDHRCGSGRFFFRLGLCRRSGSGRNRWRRPGCGRLILHIRQVLIFQLQQLLHFLDVFFQVGDALIGLLDRLFLGGGLFLHGLDLPLHRLHILAAGNSSRSWLRTAQGLTLGQLENIRGGFFSGSCLVFHCRGDLATHCLPGRAFL